MIPIQLLSMLSILPNRTYIVKHFFKKLEKLKQLISNFSLIWKIYLKYPYMTN